MVFAPLEKDQVAVDLDSLVNSKVSVMLPGYFNIAGKLLRYGPTSDYSYYVMVHNASTAFNLSKVESVNIKEGVIVLRKDG